MALLTENFNIRLSQCIFFTAITLAGFSNAAQPISDKALTDAQVAKLPPESQKFVRYMRALKTSGAAGVKAISFEQGNGMAVSAIYDKNDRPGPTYIARVIEIDDKPTVSFSVHKECQVNSQQSQLMERSIKVDDIKIGAYYLCTKSSDGSTQEIFVPRSQAGKDAIYSLFRDKKVVFVTLDGTEIPFDTIGFQPVWEEANRPAL